jgi:small subunit ribosomal protein S8
MSMTDPVADFLTRLRNAAKAQHQDVAIPSSKLKRELARILKEQGYIEGFSVQPPEPGRPGEQITVTLKYTADRKPVISGMQRVSRPGQRTYVDHSHIPRIQGGMGTAIISTSKGVMTGHEARQQGVGGEVVARVW